MGIGSRAWALLLLVVSCLAAMALPTGSAQAVTVEITIPGEMYYADVSGHSPVNVLHFGESTGISARSRQEKLAGGQVRQTIEVEPCHAYEIQVRTKHEVYSEFFFVPKDAPATIKIEFRWQSEDFAYAKADANGKVSPGGVKTTKSVTDTHDLEMDPACHETRAAVVPPVPTPKPAPGPSVPSPPAIVCRTPEQQVRDAAERADVERQLARKTAEYARLKRTLDDDTHNMNVNDAVSTDRARAAAVRFRIAVTADNAKLSSVEGEILSLRLQLDGIDSRKPCPPPGAGTAAVPQTPATPAPCRTPADDARYLELDAELERLLSERLQVFKAAVDRAGQDALEKHNRRLEDLQRMKDEIRSRSPCPPEPKAAEVPPPNEHGMAPIPQGGPSFGFGFGFGGGFGLGGGSDDEQRDRGFRNDRNRRP